MFTDVIHSSQIISSTPTTGGSPTTDPTTTSLSSLILILVVIVVVGSAFLVLIIVIVGGGVIICYTARYRKLCTCLRIIITTIHFRKSKNTNCNKHIEEYDLGFESEQDNHVGLVSIQDEKCNRLY